MSVLNESRPPQALALPALPPSTLGPPVQLGPPCNKPELGVGQVPCQCREALGGGGGRRSVRAQTLPAGMVPGLFPTLAIHEGKVLATSQAGAVTDPATATGVSFSQIRGCRPGQSCGPHQGCQFLPRSSLRLCCLLVATAGMAFSFFRNYIWSTTSSSLASGLNDSLFQLSQVSDSRYG